MGGTPESWLSTRSAPARRPGARSHPGGMRRSPPAPWQKGRRTAPRRAARRRTRRQSRARSAPAGHAAVKHPHSDPLGNRTSRGIRAPRAASELARPRRPAQSRSMPASRAGTEPVPARPRVRSPAAGGGRARDELPTVTACSPSCATPSCDSRRYGCASMGAAGRHGRGGHHPRRHAPPPRRGEGAHVQVARRVERLRPGCGGSVAQTYASSRKSGPGGRPGHGPRGDRDTDLPGRSQVYGPLTALPMESLPDLFVIPGYCQNVLGTGRCRVTGAMTSPAARRSSSSR